MEVVARGVCSGTVRHRAVRVGLWAANRASRAHRVSPAAMTAQIPAPPKLLLRFLRWLSTGTHDALRAEGRQGPLRGVSKGTKVHGGGHVSMV